jgi:hypothetical protein
VSAAPALERLNDFLYGNLQFGLEWFVEPLRLVFTEIEHWEKRKVEAVRLETRCDDHIAVFDFSSRAVAEVADAVSGVGELPCKGVVDMQFEPLIVVNIDPVVDERGGYSCYCCLRPFRL